MTQEPYPEGEIDESTEIEIDDPEIISTED
jgi:hypothetical protein